MAAAGIRWQDKPPREHGGVEACGLSCRGVWREVRGHPDNRRGWRWQCDHLACPARAAATAEARDG